MTDRGRARETQSHLYILEKPSSDRDADSHAEASWDRQEQHTRKHSPVKCPTGWKEGVRLP